MLFPFVNVCCFLVHVGYLPEFNILLMLRRRAFFIYFDYLPRDAFGKSSSGLAIEIVLNGGLPIIFFKEVETTSKVLMILDMSSITWGGNDLKTWQ